MQGQKPTLWNLGATSRLTRRCVTLSCVALILVGCSEEPFDTSTPEKALDAMRKMVGDGRPERLVDLLHIEARDIMFDDGVTERSAIDEVLNKTGDLLAQLHRVSRKLNERFPDETVQEANLLRGRLSLVPGGRFEERAGAILTDPFAFISESRERVTAVDLGDGTAAVLWDGEPPFGGVGLQMIETSAGWKFDVPVDMPPVSEFRPETRDEWRVVANMMLAFENALRDFEDKLDAGEFRSLNDACSQAGRMLGESAFIQGMIYSMMKQKDQDDPESSNTGSAGG